MPSRARVQVHRGAQWAGALSAMLVTLCSPSVAGDCLSHINVSGGPLVAGAADTLSVTLLVRETEVVGRLLYQVTWDEDVSPPIPNQGDFVNYFHVDDSAARELRVTVKESLIGLPDYPSRKTHITASVVFPAFSDGDVCSLVLSHILQDDNTQAPAMEVSSGSLHIAKDSPTSTPLQGLTVTVTDNDATTPNNLVEVVVEGACPLTAGEKQYGGVAGESHLVLLHLISPLNHLVNETLTCTLRVTDMGSPPLSSRVNLTLYVVEDLPTTTATASTTNTTFTLALPFYLAEVWPGMEVGSSLSTFPAPVKVKEDDLTLSQVTFALRDAWPGVNGTEYFAINSFTGQVFLARELDGSWAAGGGIFVPLVIQAQDSTGSISTAVLHVVMGSEGTPTYHLQPSAPSASSCRPASSTACSCPATSSQGRPRLSFTRLSYAAEVFSTDTFVGRVEARLGGRRGLVRYSWASPANVTSFVLNTISGVITIGPFGVPLGRHLLTVRATAGRLNVTAQVSVRVLEKEEKEEGGGSDGLRRVRTARSLRSCEPCDLVGLQVAVGVLASLLGVILLAAAVSGVLLYRRRKAREARAQTEVKHISTLGSAYPNLSFSRESPE